MEMDFVFIGKMEFNKFKADLEKHYRVDEQFYLLYIVLSRQFLILYIFVNI